MVDASDLIQSTFNLMGISIDLVLLFSGLRGIILPQVK